MEKYADVMRIVYPVDDNGETDTLYVTPWTPLGPSNIAEEIPYMKLKPGLYDVVQSLTNVPAIQNDGHYTIKNRETIQVAPKKRLNFCTYFNAFPAAHWFRLTDVKKIRLALETTGPAKVYVYRSNARGKSSLIKAEESKDAHKFTIDFKLDGFFGGGMVWFDVENIGTRNMEAKNASWQVEEKSFPSRNEGKSGTLSIAMTTFNRPTYCMNQLKRMSRAPETLKHVDSIYVIDQGNNLVQDQIGFEGVKKALGGRLQIIRQGNIGGSGGFSRGMYETIKAGKSRYVMLLDDDAISEPECILRAAQFGDFTKKPTIVGGAMFNLDDRCVLYAEGENFDRYSATFGHSPEGRKLNHNFNTSTYRDTPSFHTFVETDYSGWWMNLIPVTIMKEIGLAMPVFIKYDDVEYPIRAKESKGNYSITTLPGVALWHIAWHDKAPDRTWETYFETRNGLLAAILHTGGKAGKGAATLLFKNNLKSLLLMSYSSVVLRLKAVDDLYKGPDYISDTIAQKRPEMVKIKSQYTDGVVEKNPDKFPEPYNFPLKKPLAGGIPTRPTNSISTSKRLLKNILRNAFIPPVKEAYSRPEVYIDGKFPFQWKFEAYDSVIFSMPDGQSAAWHKRNPKLFRKLLKDSWNMYKRLKEDYPKLRSLYKGSDFTSIERWERIFAENAAKED
jgi:galactofuranosylgalactofuranosylrhamnosyl-N-acetylglucosaminyl-diphospho-decaprenol beta-1,5/1,6-galactofuranosyltransferase